MSSRGPKVYIVGLGLPELHTLTRRAYEVLSRCRTLFVNNPGVPLFNDICPDVRGVGQFSRGSDPESYGPFIEAIVSAARRRSPVAFAIYGHPMFYEGSAIELLRGCRKARVDCEIVPGISTVDAILAQLSLPLESESGLQVTSAVHLLSADPDPEFHVIVYKVCETLQRSRLLRPRLLRIYPPSHRVALVKCPSWEPGRVRWFPLRELPPKDQRPDVYVSLLIPPLAAAPKPARRGAKA